MRAIACGISKHTCEIHSIETVPPRERGTGITITHMQHLQPKKFLIKSFFTNLPRFFCLKNNQVRRQLLPYEYFRGLYERFHQKYLSLIVQLIWKYLQPTTELAISVDWTTDFTSDYFHFAICNFEYFHRSSF